MSGKPNASKRNRLANRKRRDRSKRRKEYVDSIGMGARNRMCGDKNRFFTQVGALNAAIDAGKKFGKPMYAYRCPVCGHYHITSKPQHTV